MDAKRAVFSRTEQRVYGKSAIPQRETSERRGLSCSACSVQDLLHNLKQCMDIGMNCFVVI